MLGPVTDSLLMRILFALAYFASSELLDKSANEPNVWSVMWMILFFVIGRTLYQKLADEWCPTRPREWMNKDVVITFIDSNWVVIMYVIVQWLVDLFHEWWRINSDSVIVAIAVTEGPVLMLQMLIINIAITDFGRHNTMPKTKKRHSAVVARSIMGQLDFSIAFFISDRIKLDIDMTPETWDLIWLMIAFVVWYNVVNKLFDAWIPESTIVVSTATITTDPSKKKKKTSYHEESLKFLLRENVDTINTALALIVTAMFVNVFSIWWREGEHWIVALSLFVGVIYFGIFTALYIKQRQAKVEGQIPDYMVNRALFSMAMFVARKGVAYVDVHKTIWRIMWLIIFFVIANAVFDNIMMIWKKRIELYRRVTDETLGDDKKLLLPTTTATIARRKREANAEEIMMVTTKKCVNTFFTTLIIFIVRWLVEAFAFWWSIDGNKIVAACIMESIMLILIASINLGKYREGHYDEYKADSDDFQCGLH